MNPLKKKKNYHFFFKKEEKSFQLFSCVVDNECCDFNMNHLISFVGTLYIQCTSGIDTIEIQRIMIAGHI